MQCRYSLWWRVLEMCVSLHPRPQRWVQILQELASAESHSRLTHSWSQWYEQQTDWNCTHTRISIQERKHEILPYRNNSVSVYSSKRRMWTATYPCLVGIMVCTVYPFVWSHVAKRVFHVSTIAAIIPIVSCGVTSTESSVSPLQHSIIHHRLWGVARPHEVSSESSDY